MRNTSGQTPSPKTGLLSPGEAHSRAPPVTAPPGRPTLQTTPPHWSETAQRGGQALPPTQPVTSTPHYAVSVKTLVGGGLDSTLQ